MGRIAFAVERKVEKVLVAQVVYEQGQQKEIKTRGGDPLKPQMLNTLVTERSRNAVLLEILVMIMSNGAAARGKRKVIVLSDRLEHLDLLMGAIKATLGVRDYSYGKYVGGMTERQRDKSAECDMIFGTFSMASEALDIPALDTLVLASPKYDVEHAAGPILRPCYGKMTPVIIDIVDPFSYYQNYGWGRHRFYSKHKYRVTRESHLTLLPKFVEWLNSIDSNVSIDSDVCINDMDEDSDEPEGWLDE
jgi:superfamily II DNA or RNA helicase